MLQIDCYNKSFHELSQKGNIEKQKDNNWERYVFFEGKPQKSIVTVQSHIVGMAISIPSPRAKSAMKTTINNAETWMQQDL